MAQKKRDLQLILIPRSELCKSIGEMKFTLPSYARTQIPAKTSENSRWSSTANGTDRAILRERKKRGQCQLVKQNKIENTSNSKPLSLWHHIMNSRLQLDILWVENLNLKNDQMVSFFNFCKIF